MWHSRLRLWLGRSQNHSRGRLCYMHSSPAAADPGERSAVVPEARVHAAEEGAELAGVVLDVADAVDVQLAARELAVREAARAGERLGRLGGERVDGLLAADRD